MSRDLWEAATKAAPGTKFVEKDVGLIVPITFVDKVRSRDEELERPPVEVVSNQHPIPSYYSPSSACYEPVCNHVGEAAWGVEDHRIAKNKRLKLGIIKLPTMTPVPCLGSEEVTDGLLSRERVLKIVKASNAELKLVFRAILELDVHEFPRSDLTRALRNKMKAQEIKYLVGQLVRKGVLTELPAQSTGGNKGGRPKSEQYQLLFDKDTIPLTELDAVI